MTDRTHAAASPEIDLRRERTFGQVISDTLSVLGSNITAFLPALFVVAAAPLILLIGSVALAGSIAGPLIAALVAIPLFWTLMAATFAYLLLYEDGFFAQGGHLTAGVLWAATRPLLGTVMGVQILTMLVLFVPIGLAFGLAAALESWALGVIAGVIWFGVMLAFGPGLGMATPVAVMEGTGFGAALRRGVELVRGFWGQTIGVTFVASILAGVFGFPFSMGAGIASVLVEGTAGAALYGVLTALGYCGYVVLFGVTLVQYFNLVERKEGRHLDARIEEIGVEDDDEPLF